VRSDDGWHDYDVVHADIPGLVARLVAEGMRIHAVEPKQTSLEDRFLALVRHA
jgi:hypothetical protein